jgi:uncharacterized protein YjeT (DUF2065 family)
LTSGGRGRGGRAPARRSQPSGTAEKADKLSEKHTEKHTEKFTIVHNQGECVDIFPIHDRISLDGIDCMTYEEAWQEVARQHLQKSLHPPAVTNGAVPLVFCKEDPVMNHYIRCMHERLKRGVEHAQIMIDQGLVTCWIAGRHPALYARIPPEARLLHAGVSYHHTTLPDIGRFISQSLVQKDWKSNLILNVICNSIPCLKRNRVAFLPQQSFVHPYASVLVNLLHGLLLGLYPSTAKRPSFQQRVRCAGELRGIMTSGMAEQARFLCGHLNLLKLAVMEYVWYACNHFLVTERETICGVQGMQTFFDICPNVADAFRQETLQREGWTWARLDEVASMCVDRCVRTCKFRSGRNSPSKEVAAKWKRIGEDMDHLFDAAKEMHSVGVNGLLWKIYHREYPHLSVEDFNLIDHLHARCRVFPLPCNLAAMQSSTLLRRFSADHFQMNNMMKVHLCLKCCNKINGPTVSSKLRLCMETNELRCASCGLRNSIVSVDMLGKVLVIQGASYILCPCCGMFRRWAHTGTEFTRPCQIQGHPQGQLQGQLQERGRGCSRECIKCGKTSNLERVVVLNAQYGVHIHIYLCSKHMLPSYILKFVVDIRDLAVACVNYDQTRDRRRRMGRRRLGQP